MEGEREWRATTTATRRKSSLFKNKNQPRCVVTSRSKEGILRVGDERGGVMTRNDREREFSIARDSRYTAARSCSALAIAFPVSLLCRGCSLNNEGVVIGRGKHTLLGAATSSGYPPADLTDVRDRRREDTVAERHKKKTVALIPRCIYCIREREGNRTPQMYICTAYGTCFSACTQQLRLPCCTSPS